MSEVREEDMADKNRGGRLCEGCRGEECGGAVIHSTLGRMVTHFESARD